MALVWMEGFDWTCDPDDFTSRYDATSVYNWNLLSSFTGRNGTGRYARTANQHHCFIQKNLAIGGPVITGFAYRLSSGTLPNNYDILLLSDPNGVAHLSLSVTTAGAMLLQTGSVLGTQVSLGTVQAAIPRDTWMFVELKAVIHNTLGSVEVRIDDTTVLTMTDIDTSGGGTGTVGRVSIGHFAVSETSASTVDAFDDWYVADSSGGMDFLGSGFEVKTLAVNGAGDLSEWTPVGVASNYLAVDDSLANNTAVNDTDYVTTNVSGKRDLYHIEALPGSPGSVLGVQVSVTARRENVGSGRIQQLVKSGATIGASAAPTTLNITHAAKSAMFTINPDTGDAWAAADFDNLQIGMEVV